MPLSRLIRWAYKEPVSHFAICFDEKVVMHSNLKGVHIEWLETFKKHSEIVLQIKIKDSDLLLEERVYQLAIKHDQRSYDIKALAYMCYRVGLNLSFGIPIPKRNKWGDSNSDLCTELADCLFPIADLPSGLDTITPYQLYCYLSEKNLC